MAERRVRVLVADDSETVLSATTDLVEEFSNVAVVSVAVNVEEAVRNIVNHRPDLALIDAWLTGGGAEEAAAQIKVTSPRTCVVALASSDEAALSDRLKAAGSLGCFQKQSLGADLPGILAAIRDSMERDYNRSEA